MAIGKDRAKLTQQVNKAGQNIRRKSRKEKRKEKHQVLSVFFHFIEGKQ